MRPSDCDDYDSCDELCTNVPRDILGPEVIAPEARDWVQNAMNIAGTEEDGHYDEDRIYQVLQISAVSKPDKYTSRGKCFFCQRVGHRWERCFRLRDILEKNGMVRKATLDTPRTSSAPVTSSQKTAKVSEN